MTTAPLPADLRDLFEAGPGYLSACTMGLPTRAVGGASVMRGA
jgi:hypothetical protein